MSTVGQQLNLRLFLEGIEVPVIGATVQVNLNSPATAGIQVVPLDSIGGFKPRTMVHLFFYDYTNDLPDAQPPGAGPENQTDAPIPLSNYSLLFSGEVIGFAFGQTPTNRSVVLQCADFSTYWDTAYQMMLTYGPNGNFLTEESAIWSGGNAMFNDIIDGHSSVMNAYLNSKPQTPGLQNVKGLMGGIIALLEAMGGVPKHTHGINDFFTIAELKNHLLQQITAEQNDNTAQRLFDEKEFMAWLERGITSLGELVTFRDMIKLLFNWIYYETVPVPAPYYVPGVQQTTSTKTVKITGTYSYPKQVDDELTNRVQEAKKQFDLGNQQLHNIGWVASTALVAQDLTTSMNTILLTPDMNPNVYKNIKKALSFASNLIQANAQPKKIAGGPAHIGDNWTSIANALNDARVAGKNHNKPTTAQTKTVTSPPELDRLQTQIFRPDCFFAAPPKCNVIFPEQYTQFNYSRNYLQEVTRLRLQTGMTFIPSSEKLLASYHYAPALQEIRDLAKKQGASGIRSLLPWEKFSGILPKFELVSEINYIANKKEQQIKKNVVGQAVNYAQRAANFNYLKYRFAARSMEVAGKFNPFVVAGFPALLITRPFILDPATVSSALEQAGVSGEKTPTTQDVISNIGILAPAFNAPTHYLGMIASLTHQVGQDGGMTNLTMTHARSHRITQDDFLSLYSAQYQTGTQQVEVNTLLDSASLISKGDYQNLKFLIDITPQDAPDEAKDIAKQNQQSQQPLDPYGSQQPLQQFQTTSRPSATFRPANLDSLAPILQATSIDLNSTVVASSTLVQPSGDIPLRAKTTQAQRPNGTKILSPATAGKLRVGGKGPKGGTITQIQVATDQVVAVSIQDLEFSEQGKTGRKQSVRTALKQNKRTKTVYVWQKAVIYENLPNNKVARPIPVEESLRPPWFSPLYSNLFIGDNIYQPFFGIGSLVDQAIFQTPIGTGATGANRQKQQELVSQIQAADGDITKIQQIMSSATPDQLSDIPSIEQSADVLAYLYGEVKRLNLDVHRFISDYTHRPIATLENVLGTVDLTYTQNGNTLTKTAGVPGFHSTAVGPFSDLVGLLDNPDQQLPRLKVKGKQFAISKDLDPRPDRRAAVKAYSDELNGGTGSLGIGLLG
jgi:hypothetical protein